MEEDELRSLSKKQMQDTLDELHKHFKAKFNKVISKATNRFRLVAFCYIKEKFAEY